mgnify:CR=1 FL=1
MPYDYNDAKNITDLAFNSKKLFFNKINPNSKNKCFLWIFLRQLELPKCQILLQGKMLAVLNKNQRKAKI